MMDMEEAKVFYDQMADAVYIRLRPQSYDHGENLGSGNRIDFGGDGTPIGMLFLNLQHGVMLREIMGYGLAAKDLKKVESILRKLSVPLY